MWGGGAVVSTADSRTANREVVIGSNLTVSSEYRRSTGVSLLTPCYGLELFRAYVATGSLSRMYKKFCIMVK